MIKKIILNYHTNALSCSDKYTLINSHTNTCFLILMEILEIKMLLQFDGDVLIWKERHKNVFKLNTNTFFQIVAQILFSNCFTNTCFQIVAQILLQFSHKY